MTRDFFFLLIVLFKLLITIIVQILFPWTNIASVMVFMSVYHYEDIIKNCVFVLVSTLFIDSIMSVSLGSFAFAWVLIVFPLITIKQIMNRFYEPQSSFVKADIEVIFVTISAISHNILIHILNSRIMYPSIQEVGLTFGAAIIVIWLTRSTRI